MVYRKILHNFTINNLENQTLLHMFLLMINNHYYFVHLAWLIII